MSTTTTTKTDKTKSTPGPWQACEHTDHSGLWIETVERAEGWGGEIAKDSNIATLRLYPDTPSCRESNDRFRANARLIAAAPDLYDACKRALNLLESIGKGNWAKTPAGDDLRAAIAKAEGRQS